MSAGDKGILGNLPRERPGRRSERRDPPSATAERGPAGPAKADASAEATDPLRELRRVGGAGARTAVRLAGGILGRVPRRENLWVAAGFSGHGFMLAPAVGRIIAGAIAGEAEDEALRVLDARRFAESRLVPEPQVV